MRPLAVATCARAPSSTVTSGVRCVACGLWLPLSSVAAQSRSENQNDWLIIPNLLAATVAPYLSTRFSLILMDEQMFWKMLNHLWLFVVAHQCLLKAWQVHRSREYSPIHGELPADGSWVRARRRPDHVSPIGRDRLGHTCALLMID